ncbi:MAG: ATP-dependent DNA helicase [Elusimicrobia bacterium]|nr:ATP-dependent DNA helicase [Elusimicrobiota bacterium]
MNLDEVFGETGALSRALPGWEGRPQQEQMAAAVADALESERSLVVEAGTGVGKSLGYLLPAALWAVKNARRVLISTHTRALQEQLLGSDLPVAAKALGELGLPLKFAMLMGADNYLCVQRLSRLRAKPPEGLSAEALKTVEALSNWADAAQSGHRSNLPMAVPQNLWDRIARDTDVCLGPGGPFWERCLWRRDRERADKAHVVVVNHALLLSGARLPPFDAMIVDEAHNLEEAAVQRFGCEVSTGRVVALCDETRLAAKLAGLPALEKAAEAALAAAAGFLRGVAGGLGLTGADEDAGGRLLETAPEAPPEELAALDQAFASAVAEAEGRPEETELRALHARLVMLARDLAEILKPAPATARWAAWPRTGPELRAAPLDVGRRLADGLFGKGVPAILTSATLAAGDGLKGFKARVGLPEARELALDSPYDYRSQAALWCAPDLPSPSDEEAHAKAVTDACAEIVARVPGGVFLLFSSWKLLKKVHASLRRRIADRPVWAQGTAGHEALLEQFAEAGDAVLLGVDTFWQGVDVPGPALSCVVLVKLPFANVSSPLEEARRRWLEDEGRDYFRDWSLPKAVMKFRQGFGRLIRSSADRGAVVCLDPRLLKKGYGKFFLEALPPCRRLESLDALARFFEDPRPAGPGA